jgi:hypothetical protein
MNVEIGAEAALFPEKEYKNRIAVAVHYNLISNHNIFHVLYDGTRKKKNIFL